MNSNIRHLEPKQLWNSFSDLNAIPRASKKEKEVIAFIVAFGEKLGLETFVDTIQNVIIKKPATKGMENRKTVILQSHLDMVHQKNNDTEFDFDTQGIQMYLDGDWVKAKGTTLGADNGIGVASILALLESKDIAHPQIEALFTIDEETGMTGAMGLDNKILNGSILLNLDTEDDDEIGIGCAGGVDVTASKKVKVIQTPSSNKAYKIIVSGLQGGHSGMDIHKGFGNSNKILNRILQHLSPIISLSEIHGGGLRNAIPRESFAIVSTSKIKQFKSDFEDIKRDVHNEFNALEKNLIIEVFEVELPDFSVSETDKQKIINTIFSIHNGVYRMSPDIENLVETSNNIAKISLVNDTIEIQCLIRSSTNSGKQEITNQLKACFELGEFNIALSGDYPGWKPNLNSEILTIMQSVYLQLFGEEPNILACHAGLECGIIGEIYPHLDMISFGPNIRGAHSPEEKASVSSVQKFWKYLIEVLKNTPEL